MKIWEIEYVLNAHHLVAVNCDDIRPKHFVVERLHHYQWHQHHPICESIAAKDDGVKVHIFTAIIVVKDPLPVCVAVTRIPSRSE